MEDIENIIKKYQRELMEFSSQNISSVLQAIPTIAAGIVQQEPAQNIVTENPQPAVEQQTQAENIPLYSTYDEFLQSNTAQGLLRIQVFGGNRFFPISGARVRVSLPLQGNNSVQQFDGLTDINGIVDNIILPTPPSALSQSPDMSAMRPFAFYTVTVDHPRYASSQFLNVPVFADVKSIQGVQLVPLVGTGESPNTTAQIQTEPFLELRGLNENGNTNRS